MPREKEGSLNFDRGPSVTGIFPKPNKMTQTEPNINAVCTSARLCAYRQKEVVAKEHLDQLVP